MNIELNKTYRVTNRWKKTFVETCYYEHEDGRVISRDTLWRSGTVLITPLTQEDVAILTEAQDEDYEVVLCLSDFEGFEFDSSWDGISEDYYSDDLDVDNLLDSYYDNDVMTEEYFDFGSYIEEQLGFELVESDQFIQGSIMVEEYGDE